MNLHRLLFSFIFLLALSSSGYSQYIWTRTLTPSASKIQTQFTCEYPGYQFVSNTSTNRVGFETGFSAICSGPEHRGTVATYRFTYPAGVANSDVTSLRLKFNAPNPSGIVSTFILVHKPAGDVFTASSQAAYDIAQVTHNESYDVVGWIANYVNLVNYELPVNASLLQSDPNANYFDFSICGYSGEYYDLSNIRVEIKYNSTQIPPECVSKWRIEELPRFGNGSPHTTHEPYWNSLVVTPSNEVFYVDRTNSLTMFENTNGSWVKTTGIGNVYHVRGELAASPSGMVYYKSTNGFIGVVEKVNGAWKNTNLVNISGYDVSGGLTVTPSGDLFYRTTSNSIARIWRDQWGYWWKQSMAHLVPNNVAGHLMGGTSEKVFYRTNLGILECLYPHNGTWLKAAFDNLGATNVLGGNIAKSPNGSQVYYHTTSNNIDVVYWDFGSGQWLRGGFSNVIPNILHNANGVHGQLEANHNGQVFYVNNNNDLECVYWSNGWKRGIMPSQWVHPNPGIAAGNTRGEIFFFGAFGRLFRLYHGPSPGCPGYSRLAVAGAVEQPIPNPPGELIEMADISVFPNPTSGQVRVNLGTTIAQDQEGGFNLEVVNMVGQVIQTLQPTDFNGQGEAVIELDDQPAGMYLLTGQIGSVIINEKVVLKK